MARSATIRASIEPALKTEAEDVLRKLGLTATQAINLFFRQIVHQKGLPFEPSVPNKETLETFRDTDAGRNLTRCQDADEMFEKLGI